MFNYQFTFHNSLINLFEQITFFILFVFLFYFKWIHPTHVF